MQAGFQKRDENMKHKFYQRLGAAVLATMLAAGSVSASESDS